MCDANESNPSLSLLVTPPRSLLCIPTGRCVRAGEAGTRGPAEGLAASTHSAGTLGCIGPDSVYWSASSLVQSVWFGQGRVNVQSVGLKEAKSGSPPKNRWPC